MEHLKLLLAGPVGTPAGGVYTRFSVLCALFVSCCAYAQEDVRFPALEGKYPVGTAQYFWVDEERPETYTRDPDDRRHVLVQVWYPAGSTAGLKRAPYLPDLDEFEDASIFRPHVDLKSRSFAEAPVADGGPFPVLVYSHGGSWSRFSASFQTEALAAEGYVVFALDHAGFNKSTKFPDGYTFVNDALPFPEETDDLRASALASWAYLGDIVAPIWAADARFVLDRIEALDRNDGQRFSGRLDLERIGMFGWSFGGSLSIQMTKDDPRIKAAVDQDGQLFGDVRESGTGRPVMLMQAPGDTVNPENDPVIDEFIGMVNAWNASLLERSTGDRYEVAIADVQHAHFSDLSLFYPMPPEQLKPERAHAIVLDFTLAFFDRYLRGIESPLLTGDTAGYPEAVLEAHHLATGTPSHSTP